MIPTSILRTWFLGLFSFFLLGTAVYCSHRWYHHAWSYDFEHQRSYFDPHLGFNHLTLLLAIAVGLFVWVLAGGLIVRALFGALAKAKSSAAGNSQTGRDREGIVASRLGRPDGSELHVESFGPEGAPVIVLTHGWGCDRTEWDYLKKDLGNRFRLIVWDLPGLGRSAQPVNKDYRLENLAGDLHTVLGLAGNRPAVLVGHSIGGMITLTFCRLFAQELGSRVAGLALVHTTYTNPVRTTSMASMFTALERPLIVPLLHVTIALAPLVWLMNWMSYLNGSSHLSSIGSGFAGHETWEQVDHITRLGIKASPAVMARGMFGMLAYDATATLKSIQVPALIIAGDRDPVCKPVASERMRQDIPGAQLTPLSPAKHMGLIEQHKVFGARIGEFAAACFKSAPPAPGV
ncbi:MAG TPA: alpha/beta hydrolase [Chthoniobacterales bacterium]